MALAAPLRSALGEEAIKFLPLHSRASLCLAICLSKAEQLLIVLSCKSSTILPSQCDYVGQNTGPCKLLVTRRRACLKGILNAEFLRNQLECLSLERPASNSKWLRCRTRFAATSTQCNINISKGNQQIETSHCTRQEPLIKLQSNTLQ